MRCRGLGAYALAVLPLLYLIGLLMRLHVDVPFWDQWELVPMLQKLHQGTLSVADVWAQHNEHRPMFPLLVMLALASATSWNIDAEILANLFAGVAIVLVYVAYLRSTWAVSNGPPAWMLPLVTLIALSPNQWENWLWGWQLQVIMNVLAAAAGCFLVADSRGRVSHLAAAAALGVVATYCFTVGLAYWFAGGTALWLNPAHRRPRRWAAWALAGTATLASYFYHYRLPSGPHWLSASLTGFERAQAYVIYVAKFLGTPVASYDGNTGGVAGALAIAAYGGLVVRLRARRAEAAFIFPAVLGLYSLASAAITAFGRAGLGSWQATSSRYVTLAAPLWIAIFFLMALDRARLAARAPDRLGWRNAALASIILTIALSSIASAYGGTRAAAARSAHLRPARAAMIAGADEELLARLYPDLETVKQRRMTLRLLRMSVFRTQR